jgi:cytochrome b pre-mRNA-processing protein 3
MQFNLDRLKTFFQPKAVTRTGEKLYASCVSQSRLPVFYLDYGIEDAIGARFELLTFHVGTVIHTLKALPADDRRREQAQDTAQALFDAFMLALDNTLREQGTGDLSVPKKMKPLTEVIYTRLKRWDELWAASASREDQAGYAARTIFAGVGFAEVDLDNEVADADGSALSPEALAFADYIKDTRVALSVDDILNGRIAWSEPRSLVSEAADAETTA